MCVFFTLPFSAVKSITSKLDLDAMRWSGELRCLVTKLKLLTKILVKYIYGVKAIRYSFGHGVIISNRVSIYF